MTLDISGLSAGYGGSTVLDSVYLTVRPGEVTALLGRNGAGKTTLVHTVMGMVRPAAGSVKVGGQELAGRPTHAVARAGVALVPQGRRVFGTLTVAEHLALAGRHADRGGRNGDDATGGGWTTQRVLEAWPQLGARLGNRATQLSGGEQQMLAIARALLAQPRILLLDEPSEGLAYSLLDRFAGLLDELAATGVAVLLVEQNLSFALAAASRVTVLSKGRIVEDRAAAEVRDTPDPVHALLSA